jgi:hypothetical protein
MTEPAGVRRHHFMGKSIDLAGDLTAAQLDGRACLRCGAEDTPKRPVEAWFELSSQLFECVDVEACADRRGMCHACGHEWRWHTGGGMCEGTAEGLECRCVMIRPADWWPPTAAATARRRCAWCWRAERLEDPVHGQCGVCFETRRRQQLVVLGADELAICRDCFEAAARFGRLGRGQPILFDLEYLPWPAGAEIRCGFVGPLNWSPVGLVRMS